jgi:hypothetical protein
MSYFDVGLKFNLNAMSTVEVCRVSRQESLHMRRTFIGIYRFMACYLSLAAFRKI